MKRSLILALLALIAVLAAACSGGTPTADAGVVLTWQREGGIAGFCDDLTIHASGEATAAPCRGEPVQGRLTTGQLDQLTAWRAQYASVEVEQSDGPVADGMTLRLAFDGTGGEQPGPDAQQAMLDFAQQVYADLTLE